MRRPMFGAVALAAALTLSLTGAPALANQTDATTELSSVETVTTEPETAAPEPSSEPIVEDVTPEPAPVASEVVAPEPADTAPTAQATEPTTEPVVEEVAPAQQEPEVTLTTEPDADPQVVADEEEIVVEGPDFIAPTPVVPVFDMEQQDCYTGIGDFDFTPVFSPIDGAKYVTTDGEERSFENGRSYTYEELGAEFGISADGSRIGVTVFLNAVAEEGFLVSFEGRLEPVIGININNSGPYCPVDEEPTPDPEPTTDPEPEPTPDPTTEPDPECVDSTLDRIGYFLRAAEGATAEAEARNGVDQAFCESIDVSLVTYQGTLVYDYSITTFTTVSDLLVVDMPECDGTAYLVIGDTFPEVLSEDSFEGRLVSSKTGPTACDTPDPVEPEEPVIVPVINNDEPNVPAVDVTTTYESSIGYQIVDEPFMMDGAAAQFAAFSTVPARVYLYSEVPAGTYTVSLPAVEPGLTIAFQVVVSPLDDSVGVFESETFTFTAPAGNEEPTTTLVTVGEVNVMPSTCWFPPYALIDGGRYAYDASVSDDVNHEFYNNQHYVEWWGEQATVVFKLVDDNPSDNEILAFDPDQPVGVEYQISDDGQRITLTVIDPGVGDDCLLPEPTVTVEPGKVIFTNNAADAIQVFYNESGMPDLEGPIVIEPGNTGTINTTIENLYWEAYDLFGLRFAGSGVVIVPKQNVVVTPPKGGPDNPGRPDHAPGKGADKSSGDHSSNKGKSGNNNGVKGKVILTSYQSVNKAGNPGLSANTGVEKTQHQELASTGTDLNMGKVTLVAVLAVLAVISGIALVAFARRPRTN